MQVAKDFSRLWRNRNDKVFKDEVELPQLRRPEDSIVALGQLNAVIGNRDYPEQAGVELYVRSCFAKRFLYQVLLRFPLGIVLFVLSLFDLFCQVTLTVTVQPWPVTVLTKLCGNVVFVHFEPGVNKKSRKTTANDSNDEQYSCDLVFHEQAQN